MTTSAGQLEILVGVDSPAELRRRAGFTPFVESVYVAGSSSRTAEAARHPLSEEDFAWPESVRPCWKGMDASRCAAAINPKSDDEELSRFLAGAQVRRETGLILAELGLEEGVRRKFYGTAVRLPDDVGGQLIGRELPLGVNARLAPNLEGADRDLALRIRETHDPRAHWFAVEPAPLGTAEEGQEFGSPRGFMVPLLIDDLGDAIAAVWIPDAPSQRWYVFPCGSSWASILGWLIEQGIPEHVPGAAGRVRSLGVIADPFLTRPEREAMKSLREFEQRVAAEQAELSDRTEQARASAAPTRDALLYGVGDVLKRAVASILESSGLGVEDLDATFGSGRSGDLLVSAEGRYWMVEARAAAGSPGEASVFDVVKHMRTWPNLGRAERLEGGVLILNHNHRDAPAGRPREPYRRREFIESLGSLGVTVISTPQLCEWWAAEDLDAITAAVTGPPRQYPRSP